MMPHYMVREATFCPWPNPKAPGCEGQVVHVITPVEPSAKPQQPVERMHERFGVDPSGRECRNCASLIVVKERRHPRSYVGGRISVYGCRLARREYADMESAVWRLKDRACARFVDGRSS